MGRRFRAVRILEFEFELTDSDIDDQVASGETAEESAMLIAGCTPHGEWTVVHEEISEL